MINRNRFDVASSFLRLDETSGTDSYVSIAPVPYNEPLPSITGYRDSNTLRVWTARTLSVPKVATSEKDYGTSHCTSINSHKKHTRSLIMSIFRFTESCGSSYLNVGTSWRCYLTTLWREYESRAKLIVLYSMYNALATR